MQIRRLLAAALAVGTLACLRTPPDFVVAPTFTIDETVAISHAAHAWNLVAIDQITIDDDGGWRILRAQPPGEANFIGQTDAEACVIWMRPGLAPAQFYSAILHEFGHALGLGHIPDDQIGVMNKVAWVTAFTDADMKECRRVKACPP